MKKFIIVVLLLNCLSAKAQPYFSKMYDNYGQWESFSQAFGITKDRILLVGFKANFLVTDSTKYQALFIASLKNDTLLANKLLFAKDSFNCTGFYLDTNGSNNIIISSQLDLRDKTRLDVSYFINELNNNCDSILNKKQLAIPTDFYSQAWLKTKDKIYCFGRNGQYSLSTIPGFYAINLKDTSTKYYRIGGSGKIINNVVLAKDGNFIVNGLQYQGTNGNDSAFGWYAKIDTLGNTIWNKVLDRNSKLFCNYIWGTNANNEIYIGGGNDGSYFYSPVQDTSYCFIAKIDQLNGEIVWSKRFITNPDIADIGVGEMKYKNGSLYALINYWTLERGGSQYIMFAKLDLNGNLLWKRLFSQWYLSNRFYSLTPVTDGFLICADGKDSTRAKGDADAWLIKTDTNGCIIPGCNAKDGIVQIINPEKVFTVYPNPAQNEINISNENLDLKIESLAVYDMQGQLLKTVSKTTKINTEDLANGNYLLIITTNKQQMAGKKFVIER